MSRTCDIVELDEIGPVETSQNAPIVPVSAIVFSATTR
jgi:hypothetical protein